MVESVLSEPAAQERQDFRGIVPSMLIEDADDDDEDHEEDDPLVSVASAAGGNRCTNCKNDICFDGTSGERSHFLVPP